MSVVSRSAATLILIAMMAASHAQAHIASNGFLAVHVNAQDVAGSIELSVRDTELAIGVDANGDGKVTWGEMRAAEAALIDYIGQHFSLASQGRLCKVAFQALQSNDRVPSASA